MATPIIKTVAGTEPHREGEYPFTLTIGYSPWDSKKPVARIEEELENMGHYGIIWFKAFDEQGNLLGKMNGLHVTYVLYGEVSEQEETPNG